ncbi:MULTISPECIES: TnsD family Tn7-like transposition protein [Vibrio harveyi group]|nr:TnsD family Tn7-like transposition protein [Vibrio parahaemolyticus]WMN65841.1 TnsD family transposase [Vibrio parahaemolyticus]WMN72078.1 TnsD family transposase [Vibrio parahaemolyticus]
MFLKPIEGECVYGLVARHHAASALRSLREKNRQLLSRSDVRINPQLPCMLKQISEQTSIDVDNLLYYGTCYPVVAASIQRSESTTMLKLHMLSNDGSHIAALSRATASRLRFNSGLKCCRQCLEEDLRNWGHGIWHTIHQYHGMFVCPKHACWLQYAATGADGLNKRIELPPTPYATNFHGSELCLERALRLALFISSWHDYERQLRSGHDVAATHSFWMSQAHLLTLNGHIRQVEAISRLQEFWVPLFADATLLPSKLYQFNFLRNLLSSHHNSHYIQHALLGGFFAENASCYLEQFKQVAQPCKRVLHEPRVHLSELESGNSLRSVAKATGYSMGYLTALAQRNGITVNHRFKRLSNSLVDRIIRLAFRGLHRRDIAKLCDVSVGTVEQKINSISGLATWRKRLWFCKKRYQCRQDLKSIICQNPAITRTEIKHLSSCYIWLFRYDKDWLSQHLPKRVAPTFHPSIDWDQVDKKLAKQIRKQVKSASSVSHVERQMDSQHSLIKNRKRLPLSIRQAEQIVTNSKNKEP